MTGVAVPRPSACPICKGDGVQPVLVVADSDLGRLVAQSGIRLKLTGGPCLSCRCWCGEPSESIGGMCNTHESESFLHEDDAARRRADV